MIWPSPRCILSHHSNGCRPLSNMHALGVSVSSFTYYFRVRCAGPFNEGKYDHEMGLAHIWGADFMNSAEKSILHRSLG